MPDQGGCLPAPDLPIPLLCDTHIFSSLFLSFLKGSFLRRQFSCCFSRMVLVPFPPPLKPVTPRLRSHPSVTGRAVLERKPSVVAEQGA
uniref:Uncharacterized protein n=1 Tax=Mandrillus leucophaeus TaxID=9568 RepID=A0A2K5XU29_MANLE